MENKDLDAKRIFLFALLVLLMMFALQTYTLFFSPKETRKPEQTRQEKTEAPNLLLGTTREGQPPKNVQEFDFQNFKVSVAQEGGKIVSIWDKKYNHQLVSELEKKLNVYPLEVFTGNPELDFKLNFSPYQLQQQGNSIRLEYKDEQVRVVKTLSYMGSYFKLTLQVEGITSPLYVLAGNLSKEDSFYTHAGPVLNLDGKVIRISTEDVKGKEIFQGSISFAGEENRYYFKGFSGKIDTVAVYNVDGKDTFVAVRYKEPIYFYAGAKEYTRIKDIGLVDVIDWGMLKWIVKPLFVFMYFIYEHLHSWVVSILVLTLIVRVFMIPLTYKSTISMMKLSELAPKMQEIREKYKNDPVKMQEEIMKLYSEAGFNPLSGCLPILFQIPVFFALYKVLIITADLQLASLLWIPSLAQKDPYYILPILMGLTMIGQQFISPNPDKSQNVMMYVSSVIFTFLFASFPSGLVLYWTFNNILNIGQSYFIKKYILKDKGKMTKEKTKRKK
ncbi:membrane protein insertase YidC [Thermocrinis minervae]|uniref:Membrane protein insertase YidC n=1 Tax=Thermocrinis minervae TaxID=381751 RepID=A0A1M6RC30_9AQUI|nr:membrane protein insertase YidC [Thermocrinis minervae]SHK29960.1 YidC/Oxa1 family membrane protein insertase [Thermocrinis minervae]